MARLYCICRKPEGNRFMIECSKCKKWYHGSCVGVSKKKSQDFKRRHWYCPKCKNGISSNSEPNAAVGGSIAQLRKEMQGMTEKFGQDFRTVITELKDQKEEMCSLKEVVNSYLHTKNLETEETLKTVHAKDMEIESLKVKVLEMQQLLIDNTSHLNESMQGMIERFGQEFQTVTSKLKAQKEELCYLKEVLNGYLNTKNLETDKTLKTLHAKEKEIESLKVKVSEMQELINNTSQLNKSAMLQNLQSQNTSARGNEKRSAKKSLSLGAKDGVKTKTTKVNLPKKYLSQPPPIMDQYDLADANDFKTLS